MVEVNEQILDIFSKDKSYFENVTWTSFPNKYNDQNLSFKDGHSVWNFPICNLQDGTLCYGNIGKRDLKDFYEYIGERIELALNLVRGKSNEELKSDLAKILAKV